MYSKMLANNMNKYKGSYLLLKKNVSKKFFCADLSKDVLSYPRFFGIFPFEGSMFFWLHCVGILCIGLSFLNGN